MELTVLMPCLDEAETVGACVRQAAAFLAARQIDGEVLVADNGSADGSPAIAARAGARVVTVAERGYGSALMGGIVAARGRYVVMGDADGSYDFSALEEFVARLRGGADLVVGNRFRGGIAPGAMKPLHRYLGNPVLSFIGRLFFRNGVGDFHCGLRGFRRLRLLSLGLQACGMEFASEMVVRATLAGMRIEQVPTTLAPDGRSHPSHLRSWRDGWRHLRFLLLFSPRWLFLFPGVALLAAGVAVGAAAGADPPRVGSAAFDAGMLAAAGAMVVVGFQATMLAAFAHAYASAEGFIPQDSRTGRLLARCTLERGLLAGGALAAAGLAGLGVALARWHGAGAGGAGYEQALRVVIPSVTALALSCQLILGVFFLSILSIRRRPALRPAAAGPPAGNGRRRVRGEGVRARR